MEDGAHEKPDQNPVAIGLTQQLLVADGGLNSYRIFEKSVGKTALTADDADPNGKSSMPREFDSSGEAVVDPLRVGLGVSDAHFSYASPRATLYEDSSSDNSVSLEPVSGSFSGIENKQKNHGIKVLDLAAMQIQTADSSANPVQNSIDEKTRAEEGAKTADFSSRDPLSQTYHETDVSWPPKGPTLNQATPIPGMQTTSNEIQSESIQPAPESFWPPKVPTLNQAAPIPGTQATSNEIQSECNQSAHDTLWPPKGPTLNQVAPMPGTRATSNQIRFEISKSETEVLWPPKGPTLNQTDLQAQDVPTHGSANAKQSPYEKISDIAESSSVSDSDGNYLQNTKATAKPDALQETARNQDDVTSDLEKETGYSDENNKVAPVYRSSAPCSFTLIKSPENIRKAEEKKRLKAEKEAAEAEKKRLEEEQKAPKHRDPAVVTLSSAAPSMFTVKHHAKPAPQVTTEEVKPHQPKVVNLSTATPFEFSARQSRIAELVKAASRALVNPLSESVSVQAPSDPMVDPMMSDSFLAGNMLGEDSKFDQRTTGEMLDSPFAGEPAFGRKLTPANTVISVAMPVPDEASDDDDLGGDAYIVTRVSQHYFQV